MGFGLTVRGVARGVLVLSGLGLACAEGTTGARPSDDDGGPLVTTSGGQGEGETGGASPTTGISAGGEDEGSTTRGDDGPKATTTGSTETSGDAASESSSSETSTSGGTDSDTGGTGTTGDSGTTGGTTAAESSGSGSSGTTGGGPGEVGFGDCLPGSCVDAERCIIDETPTNFAVCSFNPCTTVTDCPLPPPGGNATRTCAEVAGFDGNECALLCNAGQTCPTGMQCVQNFLCMWPVDASSEQGFGDCTEDPTACLPGESCITVGDPPTRGVCALVSCSETGDCPSAPPGGTSTPTCGEILAGSDGGECILPCNPGQCPGGMTCVLTQTGNLCMWPS